MKTITIHESPNQPGRRTVYAVLVPHWFPGLTKDQILENAIAAVNGFNRPHDDPNLIEIVVEHAPNYHYPSHLLSPAPASTDGDSGD